VRRRVELVDEGEGVAGGLRDSQHPPPHGVPVIAEGVEAGVGVRERGAGPGLHVAEVPREPRPPGAAHPLHLRRRLPELRLRHARHLRAVASAAADVGGPVAGAVGTHHQRGARQAARATAHRACAGEQRALAHARVPRRPARPTHEVRRGHRAHGRLVIRGPLGLRPSGTGSGHDEEQEERHNVLAPSHLSRSVVSLSLAGRQKKNRVVMDGQTRGLKCPPTTLPARKCNTTLMTKMPHK
jgi:hypothetical protein